MATGKDLNNTENLDQKEEHACTSDDKERKFRSDNLSNSVSRDENETHDGNRTADSAAVDCDKKSHDARPIDGKGTTESKSGGKDSKQNQKQSRKKKEEYTITFFYLQNVDSARDLLMTSIPAGMKIIFEERIGNVHVGFKTYYQSTQSTDKVQIFDVNIKSVFMIYRYCRLNRHIETSFMKLNKLNIINR